MQQMRVGVILPMGSGRDIGEPQSYADLRAIARDVEAAGLDAVWVYDHLLGDGPDDADQSPWEAWSVLCALAEATDRVRLGTLVLAMSFRNAGVLARMADTVQEISGNRLVLGVGAGWHEPEYTAFGLPFERRVRGFAEGLQIVAGMLRDGRATVAGTDHAAVAAPVRLRPGRLPPELLVAGVRPRMLALTAAYADSWNLAWFGVPAPRYRETSAALDRACDQVGRDPATLARTVGLRLTDRRVTEDETRIVGGDAARLADVLAAWQDCGVAEAVVAVEPTSPSGLATLFAAVDSLRG